MPIITLDYDPDTRRHEKNGTVTAGTTTDWIVVNYLSAREVLCACIPGSGGGMTLEYTLDPKSAVIADTAEELEWNPGTVTVSAGQAFPSTVTAVRFTATTVDGKYRVVA